MNSNRSVIDEHNATDTDHLALVSVQGDSSSMHTGEHNATDTDHLALVSAQGDSSSMHTYDIAHWMKDCLINSEYHRSPAEANERYHRLLHSFFCAYRQRATTESNRALGDKFHLLRRNLVLHERAQQQHRPSHEPCHPYLSYADFIEAIGHHAYLMDGTREKCHTPGECFEKPWHLPSMNYLLKLTKTDYKFVKQGDLICIRRVT